MSIPAGLAHLQGSEEGAAWLRALPDLIRESAERWSLRVGPPYPYANASLVVQATAVNGRDCVLKLQFPDRESEHEAEALAVWGGEGAVQLLAHDQERHALLLERCVPGTPLSSLDPESALDVAVGLLPRLWKPAGAPFRGLREEAAWWRADLAHKWERAGRPFERYLLDAALEALRDLPGTQGEQVLVHQDLHADNVLRAEREPWLVIDPKPLTGEREFGVAPLVRGGELGHSRGDLRHRLARLTGELGLDRERVRAWTLAQTIAWAFEGDRVLPHAVDCARWLSDAA